MIKSITTSSKHLNIGGGLGAQPYINQHNGQLSVGQVRYNPNSAIMEVYDGNGWLSIGGGYANVGMSPAAESAIDWAIKKQAEEYQLQAMLEKHPGLKEAYERLEIMKALCLEEEKKHD